MIRPWPHEDEVIEALEAQQMQPDGEAGTEDVERLYDRLLREDGTPPFGLAARELLVLRSTHAVTFAAGWPMRHVQIILRRYATISQARASWLGLGLGLGSCCSNPTPNP